MKNSREPQILDISGMAVVLNGRTKDDLTIANDVNAAMERVSNELYLSDASAYIGKGTTLDISRDRKQGEFKLAFISDASYVETVCDKERFDGLRKIVADNICELKKSA